MVLSPSLERQLGINNTHKNANALLKYRSSLPGAHDQPSTIADCLLPKFFAGPSGLYCLTWNHHCTKRAKVAKREEPGITEMGLKLHGPR